jgi:site-specific DNA recombinase
VRHPQLRTDCTDTAVWQKGHRLLHNPDLIPAEYERRLHHAQHPDADRPDLVTAAAQIAKLRRGVARLIDGYAEGLIEKAEFEQRITGPRHRIKIGEQQAAALRDEAALRRTLSLLIGRLEDFAKQVQERMTTLDWSLQRDLIRLLVKRSRSTTTKSTSSSVLLPHRDSYRLTLRVRIPSEVGH